MSTPRKHYTITEKPLYNKVMYLITVTWCDAVVGEYLYSHKVDAEAYVEYLKQLDAQDR